MNMLNKLKEIESKALRDSARGQPCHLRMPGGPHPFETVVLMHDSGGGMGDKHSDEKSCYGCHRCHTLYDAMPHDFDIADEAMAAMGTSSERRALTLLYAKYLFLQGHYRTLDAFRAAGLVVWK